MTDRNAVFGNSLKSQNLIIAEMPLLVGSHIVGVPCFSLLQQ